MRLVWLLARPSALVAVLFVLAACTPPAAPSPTAAPAAPPVAKSAPKPTEKPAAVAEKPAAKATDQPAAKPAFDEKAVADFYKGKTVRIVVGFAAGGGYDTYSRLIAKHLGSFIPGNPTVIVENMTGAGSIVAANQVQSSLPKDGTVVGNISGPIILEQLFKTGGVEFDMAKFRYIAVPVPEAYIMLVHKRAGITRFDELLGPNSKQLVVGAIPGSTVEHAPVLLRDAINANIKVVSGYDGTSKVRLALDSGEVDAFFNTWQSVKITNMDDVKGGNWVVLAQMNDRAFKDLPGNVPTILNIAKTEEQRQILLFGTSYPNQYGKVYVVSPDVPADRAAALEAAFMKTMASREFLADAEKGKLEIAPIGGDETRKLVQATLGMSQTVKDKLQKVMKGGS